MKAEHYVASSRSCISFVARRNCQKSVISRMSHRERAQRRGKISYELHLIISPVHYFRQNTITVQCERVLTCGKRPLVSPAACASIDHHPPFSWRTPRQLLSVLLPLPPSTPRSGLKNKMFFLLLLLLKAFIDWRRGFLFCFFKESISSSYSSRSRPLHSSVCLRQLE